MSYVLITVVVLMLFITFIFIAYVIGFRCGQDSAFKYADGVIKDLIMERDKKIKMLSEHISHLES